MSAIISAYMTFVNYIMEFINVSFEIVNVLIMFVSKDVNLRAGSEISRFYLYRLNTERIYRMLRCRLEV